MLKDKPDDLVKAALKAAQQLTQRHPVLRSVTITVVSPEAGPIAAGITTALLEVARQLEQRHPNTAVRVSAGPETTMYHADKESKRQADNAATAQGNPQKTDGQ